MTKQGGWPPTGFGGKLKALREARGWTQQYLADLATCNKFTVAKLERGLQEPAWPLVLALAKALGVGVEEFIAEEGVEAEPTPARARGRPAKAEVSEPARPRGRPKKSVEESGQGEGAAGEKLKKGRKG